VKVVDTNVLVYAVNSASAQHETSRIWLESTLNGGARVGFAWNALLAFLRLTTRPGVLAAPISVRDALSVMDEWLAQPAAVVVHPSPRHSHVLAELLTHVGSGGNLVNDAHLAALSIEHRAQIVTFDTDFARFPGVRWSRPTP
jgi:toxin-antitoxin system PIN domain toxin